MGDLFGLESGVGSVASVAPPSNAGPSPLPARAAENLANFDFLSMDSMASGSDAPAGQSPAAAAAEHASPAKQAAKGPLSFFLSLSSTFLSLLTTF